MLLNWLPWILLMKRPGHAFSRKTLPNPFISKEAKEPDKALLKNSAGPEDGADVDVRLHVPHHPLPPRPGEEGMDGWMGRWDRAWTSSSG